MIYGYVRVSTKKKYKNGGYVQNFDLQKNALVERGGVMPDNIYEDRISGKVESRKGLDELLETVKSGDSIVVWKLDRLGRNARHLLQLAEEMKEKGVSLRSLQDGIDTGGKMGSFVLKIIAAVAELESDTISERVAAGIDANVRNGGRIGRKKALTAYQRREVFKRLEDGESPTLIARDSQISLRTVYYIKDEFTKSAVI